MTETTSVRVPKELHRELKELAEKKDQPMSEVAESYLTVENSDERATLSEAESSARNEAMRVLEHVVLGECEDPAHVELREKLGVNTREEVKLAQKESVVGYCPRCGERFVGGDVTEPFIGDTPYVVHQCPQIPPEDVFNHDDVADLNRKPGANK